MPPEKMQINTNLNFFTFVGHKTNNGKRPTTGLANRIIIPNEKNVTIPAFD
jgi:hypothetical protein